MRKVILYLFAILILFCFVASTSAVTNVVDPGAGFNRLLNSPESIIDDANNSIKEIYGSTDDYFESPKNIYKKQNDDYILDEILKINTNSIQDQINNKKYGIYISYYKTKADGITKVDVSGNDTYKGIPRYLGFARDNGAVDNMDYPWDAWSGDAFPGNREYVLTPWKIKDPDIPKAEVEKIQSKAKDNDFDCDPDTGKTKTLGNPVDLNPNIIVGITYYQTKDRSGGLYGERHSNLGSDEVKTSASNYKKIESKETFDLITLKEAVNKYGGYGDIFNYLSSKYKWDKVVAKPSNCTWQECTYIAQPPTYLNWGLGLVWKKPDYYYMGIPIAPFYLLDQLNFGTQVVSSRKVKGSDGKYRYVVWAKYWVSDWDYNEDNLVPDVNFEITNGNGKIESESSGVAGSTSVHGGVTLSKEFIGDITGKPIDRDDPNYIAPSAETDATRLDQTKSHDAEVSTKGYLYKGDNKIRYGDAYPDVENASRFERYIRIVVNPNDPYSPIELKSTIALDGSGKGTYIGEKGLGDNIDTYEIKALPQEIQFSQDYSLEYDVLSRKFIHYVNGWNTDPEKKSLKASISLPEEPSGVYNFQSGWMDGSDTAGSLNKEEPLNDPDSLAGGINYGTEYGPIKTQGTTVIKRPNITWMTKKDDFGFNRSSGIFSNKGSFKYPTTSPYDENCKNDIIGKFILKSSGGISRNAWESYDTGKEYHSHTKACYDSDGNLICGHTEGEFMGYTGYTKINDIQKSGSFPNSADTINIQALIYNGSKMSLHNFGPSIQAEKTGSGNEAKRTMTWEGDRYDIPVIRYMRNLDENNNITSLTAVPGNYNNPRIFQHLDTADVTYDINAGKSMQEYFSADRNAAKDNYGNYKKYDFERAPFSTDKTLKNVPFPIKSGFFYVPYGQYTVKVSTVIYKKAGEKTEHNDIVDDVIKSFWIKPQLPTMQRNGTAVVDLNGKVYDEFPTKINKVETNSIKHCYPVSVDKAYKLVSNDKLTYDTGPDSKSYFADEKELLSHTDTLFKRILEGWSGMPGWEDTTSSWDLYNYREYVETADIHRIVEETTITFTINPPDNSLTSPLCNKKNQLKFYIIGSTKDKSYPIEIGFNPITNGRNDANKMEVDGSGTTDSITFTVVGSMYDQ